MKKKLLAALFICFACANFHAQDIDEKLELFTKNMASWTQENGMTLNTTADAFIGKIVPSIPPHFQVGLSAATTFIDTTSISDAATEIKEGLPGAADFPTFSKSFIMPTYSINLRFGGFFLPFDIGFFGTFTIPPQGADFSFEKSTIAARQLNLGVDIRYAILQGKKLMPKISVGFGYVYSNHSYTFGATSGETNKTTFSTDLSMHTIYAQLQVSKQFLFLLPFVGARAALSQTDNKYTYSTASVEEQSAKVSSNFDIKEIQPQIYAGLGFMIPFSQITLNGTYNPRKNLWSVSIHAGFRL